jgi:hypothetical protein
VSEQPVGRPPEAPDREQPVAAEPPRRTVEIDGAEALRLLGSVPMGRIAFTRQALPTIRPVNHIVDDGVVVAYEADAIDPDTHLGWSVVVTGYAHLVTNTLELARYQELLRPWVRQPMDYAVRIHPDLVTGLLLVPVDQPAQA